MNSQSDASPAGYDLIGDIHGHHEALLKLLNTLGYRELNGTYSHPEGRRLIFVGDLVDRGPAVRETLALLRSLVESGTAQCILGNHEYNILAYHAWSPHADKDGFLRPHSERHGRQVAATLQAYIEAPGEWLEQLDWLRSLPLWLELPGLRVIHACWDQRWIDYLSERLPDRRLTASFLYESSLKGSPACTAIEILLKGWEASLPEGKSFSDAEGLTRTKTRMRWWPSNSDGGTWRDWLVSDAGLGIEDEPFTTPLPGELYPASAPPVFFGHYWLHGAPRLQAPNACCLDYSIAKGGQLVAYRWDGEQVLSAAKLSRAGSS